MIKPDWCPGGKKQLEWTGPERRVTQRQRDTVWDWCQKHEEEVPWWFKDEDA